MYLEKWYGDMQEDCIPQIRYLANLHLGPLKIGYSARIDEARAGTSTCGMTAMAMPKVADGKLRWPRVGNIPAANWSNACHRPQALWSDGKRLVNWDPVVLNGNVFVDGELRCRRGYAERLQINFAPWHLGMQSLKWGRFCGQTHSLVWIQWEGRIPLKLAMLNGYTETLKIAGAMEINTANTRLAIKERHEIVSEPLGGGALSAMGWTRKLADRKFLSGIENKWYGKATLHLSDETEDHGSVIYEEVTWK